MEFLHFLSNNNDYTSNWSPVAEWYHFRWKSRRFQNSIISSGTNWVISIDCSCNDLITKEQNKRITLIAKKYILCLILFRCTSSGTDLGEIDLGREHLRRRRRLLRLLRQVQTSTNKNPMATQCKYIQTIFCLLHNKDQLSSI